MMRALLALALLAPCAAAAQPTQRIETQPPVTTKAEPKAHICRELDMTMNPATKLTKEVESAFRREFEAFLKDAAKCETFR
ncbi:MAG TPA: hypothetical protein VGH36_01725 [Acetobacteraceae bacterium]|jgi:hypothetical protein